MKPCITRFLIAALLSVPGVLNAQSFNYNASDQRTDPTFQYDANGNLINDGSTQYRYDTANRLTRTTRGTDVVEYRYDGAGNLVAVGRRTTAQTQSNWTELTPNVASSLPETLMEVTGSGTTQETVRYAYGPAGLAAMTRQVGSGAVEARMAVTDFQGTVRHLYNGVALSHSRYYDAWGRLRSSSGNGVGLTLGYTGERENADGTVYLRARHYSPALNRFLQRDSIDAGFAGQGTQGHNRYAYVSGNPGNLSDPSGHLALAHGGIHEGAGELARRAMDCLGLDAGSRNGGKRPTGNPAARANPFGKPRRAGTKSAGKPRFPGGPGPAQSPREKPSGQSPEGNGDAAEKLRKEALELADRARLEEVWADSYMDGAASALGSFDTVMGGAGRRIWRPILGPSTYQDLTNRDSFHRQRIATGAAIALGSGLVVAPGVLVTSGNTAVNVAQGTTQVVSGVSITIKGSKVVLSGTMAAGQTITISPIASTIGWQQGLQAVGGAAYASGGLLADYLDFLE